MKQAWWRFWWMDATFDRYRWYRRMCGGHWEYWYNDAVESSLWEQREDCCIRIGRPACGRGTPICEDYK